MRIFISEKGAKACIMLDSPEDIARAAVIWNKGINCQSDRGKDAEIIGDALRDAAQVKVPAHG